MKILAFEKASHPITFDSLALSQLRREPAILLHPLLVTSGNLEKAPISPRALRITWSPGIQVAAVLLGTSTEVQGQGTHWDGKVLLHSLFCPPNISGKQLSK